MGGTGRRRNLLDDLGAAVAAAIAPHRFLGLLLVLVAPLTALDRGPSAPTWAACSGFVAGALLASWRLVLVATLPAVGWILCMLVPPTSFGIGRGSEMWVFTTLCAAAGAVAGALRPPLPTRLIVPALLATPLVAAACRQFEWWRDGAAFTALAVATVLAALVAATGRLVVPAAAVFATTLLAFPDTPGLRGVVGFDDGLWIATNAVLLAWIAGRTHAALRQGRTDGQEAAARLVVRTQLSSWTSCAALGALFLYVAWIMRPGGHDEAAVGRIAGLAMAGAFLHHLARGARAPFDRLAGFGVALAMAWPVAEIVFGGGPAALAKATCLLVLPQAAGFAFEFASNRAPGRAPALLGVLAAVMPERRGLLVVAWLLVVVCLFHVVALSDVRARKVFWWAAVLGVVSGLLRTQVAETRHPVAQVAEVVGLWLVGATLALAARQTRTMTAVPDDHAVRADFDVHAERAPA